MVAVLGPYEALPYYIHTYILAAEMYKYLEAISSICRLRTHHSTVTRDSI
jgi:hypothetical protein